MGLLLQTIWQTALDTIREQCLPLTVWYRWQTLHKLQTEYKTVGVGAAAASTCTRTSTRWCCCLAVPTTTESQVRKSCWRMPLSTGCLSQHGGCVLAFLGASGTMFAVAGWAQKRWGKKKAGAPAAADTLQSCSCVYLSKLRLPSFFFFFFFFFYFSSYLLLLSIYFLVLF